MSALLAGGALLAAVMLASWAGTGGLRRYALKRSLIDIPNARSSHSTPTPRGGGVAIVLSFLAGGVAGASAGLLEIGVLAAVGGAGTLVALIGFADDHGHVPPSWRLLVHFAAALLVLGGLDVLEPMLAARDGAYYWAAWALAALGLVWGLNLYNFMDGIDGIAGVEAICVCAGACLLYWLEGRAELMLMPLLVVAAVAGFLWWNFPPAKIFMGDAGSGFLGIVIGSLALQAGAIDLDWLWAWVILLGVFVVDATWTLLRRLLRGVRVHEAHRSHAYQRAARRLGRHGPVTLGVGAINLLLLLPIALMVGTGQLSAWFGLALAYAPLLAAAVALDAGSAETRESP